MIVSRYLDTRRYARQVEGLVGVYIADHFDYDLLGLEDDDSTYDELSSYRKSMVTDRW